MIYITKFQSQIDCVFFAIFSFFCCFCLMSDPSFRKIVFLFTRKIVFWLCLIILHSDNNMSGDSKLAFPNISGDSKAHSIVELGSNSGTEISKVPINIVNAASIPLRKSSIDLLDTTIDYPEYVRSIKEKECWLLFQKMVKKGISVSYETILRGMLTPSEVRVAQKKQREIFERQASLELESSATEIGTSAVTTATATAQAFSTNVVVVESDSNKN